MSVPHLHRPHCRRDQACSGWYDRGHQPHFNAQQPHVVQFSSVAQSCLTLCHPMDLVEQQR